jgi:transcriptional regulator with XRE-family HTH domain
VPAERRSSSDVRKTTEAMHRGLSGAVIDLRERRRWGQEDLAQEISKWAARLNVTLTPDQGTISRWERGLSAPSPEHRMVLARIATKHRYTDLADIFRAPTSAWRLVGHVRLGALADHGDYVARGPEAKDGRRPRSV